MNLQFLSCYLIAPAVNIRIRISASGTGFSSTHSTCGKTEGYNSTSSRDSRRREARTHFIRNLWYVCRYKNMYNRGLVKAKLF